MLKDNHLENAEKEKKNNVSIELMSFNLYANISAILY